MAYKPSPVKRCKSFCTDHHAKVQGTLFSFPMHLIRLDSELQKNPLFLIEIPDLTKMKLLTGPMIFLDSREGKAVADLLAENKIVQYVQVEGPIHEESEPKDFFLISYWTVGGPTDPKQGKMIPFSNQIMWKTRRELDTEIENQAGAKAQELLKKEKANQDRAAKVKEYEENLRQFQQSQSASANLPKTR